MDAYSIGRFLRERFATIVVALVALFLGRWTALESPSNSKTISDLTSEAEVADKHAHTAILDVVKLILRDCRRESIDSIYDRATTVDIAKFKLDLSVDTVKKLAEEKGISFDDPDANISSRLPAISVERRAYVDAIEQYCSALVRAAIKNSFAAEDSVLPSVNEELQAEFDMLRAIDRANELDVARKARNAYRTQSNFDAEIKTRRQRYRDGLR